MLQFITPLRMSYLFLSASSNLHVSSIYWQTRQLLPLHRALLDCLESLLVIFALKGASFMPTNNGRLLPKTSFVFLVRVSSTDGVKFPFRAWSSSNFKFFFSFFSFSSNLSDFVNNDSRIIKYNLFQERIKTTKWILWVYNK